MARVKTNHINFNAAEENPASGELFNNPSWSAVETNIDGLQFGPTIAKIRRNPLSIRRTARKGENASIEAPYAFTAAFTMEAARRWIPAFLYTTSTLAGTTFQGVSVSATGYEAVVGASARGRFQSGNDGSALIKASGYRNAANNGTFAITGTPSGSEIPVTGRVEEDDPPAEALVEYAGYRCPAGDVDLVSFNDAAKTAALTSTNLDFTTLGLIPGQGLFIGGATEANQFDGQVGWGRIVSIDGNRIELDKVQGITGNAASENTGDHSEIDLAYGNTFVDVAVTSSAFTRREYRFEAVMPNLGPNGEVRYGYAIGNVPNVFTLSMQPSEFANASFGFAGVDYLTESADRADNAQNAVNPLADSGFNSANRVARMRLLRSDDGADLGGDITTMTFNVNNNVEPERTIGRLTPRYQNEGSLEITADATVIFDNVEIREALRENQDVTFDFFLRNEDGGVMFDIDKATLEGGTPGLTANASKTLSVQVVGHESRRFRRVLTVTTFPSLPPAPVAN